MPLVTRFAPSPTGLLHLGHAYAAKVAHDLARLHGGAFLLRFEDIDHTRVRDEFYTACEEDLHWLGFDPDGPTLRQLDRQAAHADAFERLRELGVLYPCFCTRREIEEEITRMPSAPQGPEGPHYPGRCRHLDDSERRRRLDSGRVPAWRLDAGSARHRIGPLTFHDLVHGSIEVMPDLLGDVILARKDIGTSYHLAVVVDDAFQGISHVTRGDDLLSSTHVHRVLQSLLGLSEPTYLHHPLVCDERGQRLAKRDDALSIRALRARGLTPGEVLKRLPPLPSAVGKLNPPTPRRSGSPGAGPA